MTIEVRGIGKHFQKGFHTDDTIIVLSILVTDLTKQLINF